MLFQSVLFISMVSVSSIPISSSDELTANEQEILLKSSEEAQRMEGDLSLVPNERQRPQVIPIPSPH